MSKNISEKSLDYFNWATSIYENKVYHLKDNPVDYIANIPIVREIHKKRQNLYKVLKSFKTCIEIDRDIKLGEGNYGIVYGVINHKDLAIKEIWIGSDTDQDSRTKKEQKVTYPDGKVMMYIPIGSYVANPSQVTNPTLESEIIIHAYATQLVEMGVTIHVLPLLSIFHSLESINLVMPRMETTLTELIGKKIEKGKGDIFKKTQIDKIFFQALFGLNCLQEYFKIVHNDFSCNNLFLKRQKTPESFLYEIDEKKIILPHCDYFLAIGDFSCSAMWKGPIVGPHLGLIDPILNEDESLIIPNWYCPTFDLLMLVSEFYLNNMATPWILDLCTRLYRCHESDLKSRIDQYHQKSKFIKGGFGICSRIKIDIVHKKFGNIGASTILWGCDPFKDWLLSANSPLILASPKI